MPDESYFLPSQNVAPLMLPISDMISNLALTLCYLLLYFVPLCIASGQTVMTTVRRVVLISAVVTQFMFDCGSVWCAYDEDDVDYSA